MKTQKRIVFTEITEDNLKERECLHKQCPECYGTGKKKNGDLCVHHVSCPCPICSPFKLMNK